MTSSPIGLLLAAGAGRRMGRPKALVTTTDGIPWVRHTIEVLRAGGCGRVLVTTGAGADEVGPLLTDVDIVPVPDWADGMGASLRAGLAAASPLAGDRLLVSLVDLVDVGPEVVARVLSEGGSSSDALARAAYDGKPGHPVLLGREHWTGVARGAVGDQGARTYLRAHSPDLVECGDLASGRDVDTPDQLAAWRQEPPSIR